MELTTELLVLETATLTKTGNIVDKKPKKVYIYKMFQQVTKGIKIAIKTTFNGVIYRGYQQFYSFSYYVSIENNSKDTVKLLERFWKIFDALNTTEFVEGEGVVGETPILNPGATYNYRSNCFLLSTTGAMKGSYKMINFETSEEFMAIIPTFQLTTTPTLN